MPQIGLFMEYGLPCCLSCCIDAELILTHSQQMVNAWQTDGVYASAAANNATPSVEYLCHKFVHGLGLIYNYSFVMKN